jgi:hypothetical protein
MLTRLLSLESINGNKNKTPYQQLWVLQYLGTR